QISTIHSYCQKVVREHFRHCGVDPQFTMGDERTIKSLYQESMNDVLDAAYQAAKEDTDLKTLLGVLPEKNLVQVMDLLYPFLLTRPNPMEWLKQQAEQEWNEESLLEHPMCETLLNECSLLINNALLQWKQAKALLDQPAFPEKYQQTISADYLTLTELEACANTSLDKLCHLVATTKFATLVRVKPKTTDASQLAEKFKTIREDYKSCLKELKKVLPTRLDSALSDMEKMRPSIRGLCWLMEALHEDFKNRKLERAVLDFGDLEHMTLEVLADAELSQLESSRFDALFVDEYQDVSAIQEAILNGLKRGDGSQFVFYVGDVKQSIYRFRQAEPTLFLSKLASFSDDEQASQRRIILNKNFRSRETVLDSVNRVFQHVMDSRVTEIDYDASAMLYPGKPSKGDPRTELHLIGGVGKRERIIRQAQLIAKDIQSTVGEPTIDSEGKLGAPLHYRDIVILLPVVKGVADKVEAELVKAGIPVYVDAAMNAMGSEEVQQVTQHLMLLDNLRNDLALIAELRSPLFDMSERELTDIRLRLPERDSTYLDALKACTLQ
ncbi:MAG: UvrD-helicase domain-containing protein, partial [Clostridia bacterium]|nr:UvrD-helicase domain-containing protein [Clostridia bacterium]